MANIFTPPAKGVIIPTPLTQLAPPAASVGLPAFAPPLGATGVGAKPDFGVTEMDESSAGRFIIIVGPPFTGKTTACLTFPNPVFMNLDNKIPVGTKCIPFHKPAFCDQYAPRSNSMLPPNRRDAILYWLYKHVAQLPADWTLILDSFSALSDAFHMQAELVEDIGTSKAGNKAQLKVFGAKLAYLESIFTLLKYASCRVIVTAHTQPEYGENGEPTGSVKPFCTGSFSDKICNYATDVVRSYVHIDPATGKPSVDAATGRVVGYRWKIRPDRTCVLVGTMLQLPPNISDIEATYNDYNAVLAKYGAAEKRLSPEPASAPVN